MRAKILVIDDEESIRDTFSIFLTQEGHEVVTAADYAPAIEIISQDHLDLIFADIVLGGYTGIDVLREVKKRGLDCPVVLVTGKPSVETAAESVRLGAFDYLAKPLRKDNLLRITNQALHHKALLDEKNRIEAEKEGYRLNLEAIFHSVQDGIITVDTEMKVLECNQAAARICGLAPEEIAGKKFTEVMTHCRKSCCRMWGERIDLKTAVREFRVECGHSRHARQLVVLSSSPLKDRNDRFRGAVLLIRDITRLTNLERELKERSKFHDIIGKSRRMQDIYNLLEDLAETETTVLISGESGTGKELVAEALHLSSSRASHPLVKVNCSALSENLLESELFGHVRGAFTGAVKDKVGRFQLANGGTLFLDEIGDISPRIQLKLLRVLQEKEFERVGDSNTMKVDVRIIAATNRSLREKVRLGEFREDLYYRLKVVEITLPPLRERLEDVPLLIKQFRKHFNNSLKKNIEGISDEAMSLLMNYPWPGNVRELKHAMEHAFILCRGQTILVEHLPADIRESPGTYARKAPVEKQSGITAEQILKALNQTDWNKAKAARVLGISRQTIYRKIEEHRITR
ncbi:MAG TPA: sigma-54-dependent Fis family transcriptional regulator [Syntrophobacteraceae bacterium]|nr:sigma-54-dependent Fis family transcriptional regulator [Syntrophobacteraceae bacterium]